MYETSKFCKTCDKPTLHARPAFGLVAFVIHAILAAITVGLWIPIAIIHALSCITSRARCRFCGR